MSHAFRSSCDRFPVELVEADVEIGFNLADMAELESGLGNRGFASRVLLNAENVFRDIEQRLPRLGDRDRGCFGPLVAELRRKIDQVKMLNPPA